MNLERKLSEWQEAGILDAGTAARIAAHEAEAARRERRRPYLLYAVGGLGALSVGIGLLSIVASNWDAIPAALKLALDFALLLGLAVAVLRAGRAARSGSAPQAAWVAEILIFVYFGAVLASIGLVAQVYHLGGAVEDALLFWALITAPVVLHGNGRFLAAVWLLSAESVVFAQVERFLDRSWHRVEDVIALTAAFLVCFALVALGQARRVRERKPAFASVAAFLGRVQILLLASIVPLAWYGHGRTDDTGGGLAAICLAGVLAASVALALRDDAARGPARAPALALAAAAPLLAYAPLSLDHERAGVLAAVSFLVLWSIVGFTAHRLGRRRLLNLATALLGIRLLIVYFEVFGSLLDTGIALLSGGVLTILLAWIWVKKTRQWSHAAPSGGAKREGEEEGAHG